MAEIVIDTPIVIPRRRGRRQAEETISGVDENAIADQAVNDIRAGLARSGANEALDNVARSGGMPTASADDAIHNDRDLETGDRDLGPSRLTGLVDRERAATHDHTIGGQPDAADLEIGDPGAFRLREPGSGVSSAFDRKGLAGDLNARFAPHETHGEENLRAMHMIPASDFEIDDMNATHNASAQYRRDLQRMADAEIAPAPPSPDVDTTHAPTSKPSGPIVDARGKPDSASPATQPREDHLGQDEQTLENAERRSRRLRILRGLGSVFGTALTMGGAAIPGLAALGNVLRSGTESIDPDAPLEEAHDEIAMRQHERERMQHNADREADRATRAEQTAFERAEAIRQGKRSDLTAETNAENAETMRLQQDANMKRLNQQATREQQNFTRRYDPQSDAANLARSRLRNAVERYAAIVRGGSPEHWDDSMAAAEHAGAEDIEPLINDIEQHTKEGVVRRGRGGGGGSRPQATPEDAAAQTAAYDEMVRIRAGQTGLTEATVRAANPIAGAFDLSNPRSLAAVTAAAGQGDVVRQSANIEQYANAIAPMRARYQSLARLHQSLETASPATIAAALHGGDRMSAVAGATRLRGQIFDMLNDYFKTYGGANVTENEMYRYLAGFNAGTSIGDPRAFTDAVARNISKEQRAMNATAAGYTPQVLSEYRRRASAGGAQ